MQTKLTKFNEYIKNIIKESLDDHSNLIIVDVQPSYEKFISFDIYNFLEYVKLFDNVLWLYNGQELGYDDDIEFWISEILEDYENTKLLDNINYFEKEYGYLRALIDQDIEDEIIINIGKYMLEHNITDSRDFTSDDLQNLNIDDENIIDILLNEDGIWIDNKLINELQQYNNCVLVGGERNECLKEIELFCEIANINFILNNKYIY